MINAVTGYTRLHVTCIIPHTRAHERYSRLHVSKCNRVLVDLVPMPRFSFGSVTGQVNFAFALCRQNFVGPWQRPF